MTLLRRAATKIREYYYRIRSARARRGFDSGTIAVGRDGFAVRKIDV